MILLCIVTIFSKSTTANADDRYVKLCERYFTEFAEDYGKFGQKDGFTYLYSDKKNTGNDRCDTNGTKKGCRTGEDQW